MDEPMRPAEVARMLGVARAWLAVSVAGAVIAGVPGSRAGRHLQRAPRSGKWVVASSRRCAAARSFSASRGVRPVALPMTATHKG
jgi:hypothetical protein